MTDHPDHKENDGYKVSSAPDTNGENATNRDIPSARPATETNADSSSGPDSGATVHIRIPKANTQLISPQGPEAPGLAPASADSGGSATAKKETSKIPLATALGKTPTIRSAPLADGPVKTIRIRPKSASAQPATAVGDDTAARSADAAGAENAKKKTSRISLDAALTSEQSLFGEADGPRPKTIRLKRPAAGSTVKVTPHSANSAQTDREAREPARATLDETARIEMPPAATAPRGAPSPTQRRTIRVKRPTQFGGAAPVAQGSAARVPSVRAGAVAAGAPMTVAPVARAKEPNAVFPIFVIMTLIVSMVTIYVFCAQAIGPNSTYTQYSYAPEGPDLGWPGKIQPIRTQN
jgi:hypothetical protein